MWLYKKKLVHSLSDLPKGTHDHFIYMIINKTNGRRYIGKKILFNKTKKKISKKVISEKKTRKRVEIITKESNWKTYYGSSKELLDDLSILGEDKFERHILELVEGKKKASYRELVHLIKNNVLGNELYYNSNILGRFFKKDI